MANKRRLKKSIKAMCGDIAGECIITRNFIPGVEPRKMEEIICDIADLQGDTLAGVSFSFDKNEKSFENGRLYREARRKYFNKAYGKLKTEFLEGVNKAVAAMNEALPQAQKDLNKKA